MAKRNTIRYLTSEQKKQFLKTLADSRKAWRDYCMFDLMLNTGLRLSETINLNAKDVHNGYSSKEVLEIKGKGDRIRQIPLNKDIRAHIDKYIRQRKAKDEGFSLSEPLFLSRNNKRITQRAVQLNLNKWVSESGLEGRYSPHCLRHTVGTELMRKCGNIRKVQEFLGHKFVSTTQIYTGVTKEDLAECAELLSV
ncbi:MAG: tyrosine-type recombinase/integrase [Candidatus Omnitrophica bacterium]|nr:tyrosine-type recombinase/integrase [Candidatus Omnitrophota bacterium]